MAGISAGIGLVTGLNITQTVSQLVSIQAAPRDALTAQNTAFSNQTTALTQLEALVLGVQFAGDALTQPSLYVQRSAASTNDSALSATVTGNPAVGQYQYTPLQLAQNDQFQSSTFSSQTNSLGAGSFTFRYGGTVNQGESLDVLNGGNGVPRGSIKITDHSGATATIDLSSAQTVDDVLQAINSNTTVHVTARASGGAIKLTDNSTGTQNLQVQDVGNGTTAAALGLAGINTANQTATGSNLLTLFNDLSLSQINDGNGVRFDNALSDLQINFQDGTTTAVDFHQLSTPGTKAQGTTTAANGTSSQVTFTAVTAGSASAGVAVNFVNDGSVSEGHETVNYDAQAKTLTFNIAAGQTTAQDIVAALSRDPTASAAFTAKVAPGTGGSGLINVSDTAFLTGPASTATTPGTLGSNSQIQFTAVNGGSSFDNTVISFVDNPNITAGHETVAYDNSNPNQPKLTFQISAGNTTAANVISALNHDPAASEVFTATNANGSNGTGLVSVNDTATTSGGAIVEPVNPVQESTIGDVLATLNSVAPGKLQASLDPNTDRIILTDLTTPDGNSTFSVSDLNGSHAAEDLGINTTAASGTITGNELIGGLKTTLLRSLNGGQGLGTLGQVSLTNRNGQSATADLSTAQTLDDAIAQINAAGQSIGISATYNSARDGIKITDASGGNGNLVIANGDGTNSADKLQIAVNSAVSTKNSGDLHEQFVSVNSLLSSLNGGGGVAQGTFTIVDSTGNTGVVNVNSSTQTVGDVIDSINRLGLGVHAQINNTGDGIVLIDTANGGGTLGVTEGNSTTAHDLHLLGGQTTESINGQPTKVIDGSNTTTVAISSTDTLQDVTNKINALNAGVSANIFSDGSTVKPYRFTLTSQNSGLIGALQIDTSNANFSFNETTKAQDAIISVGDPSTGILAVSSTNSFTDTLPGVTLNVNNVSATPVTISISATTDALQTAVQTLVDAYNKLNDALNTDTAYDTTSNTGAVLYGDAATQQVHHEFQNLFTGQIFGAGSITSLAQLGISFDQNGDATLDTSKLQTLLTQNPTSVQTFLTKASTGITAQIDKAANYLAGDGNSLIVNRTTALNAKTAANTLQINQWNTRLTALTASLTAYYQQNEINLSQIQANYAALTSIAQLANLGVGDTSNSSSSSSSVTPNSNTNSALASASVNS